MRRFISTLSIAVWSIVLCLGCFAGTAYAANLTDKSIGISIDLDDRLVKKSNYRGYRVFSSANNTASVFIRPAHDLSMYHLREDLKGEGGGFDDVDGIDLVVMGEVKNAQVTQGSGIIVLIKGRIDEYKVKGVFSGFAGFGEQKFYVIAVARPDYWNEWMPSFQAMLESVRFVNIDYSDMMNEWYDRLSGKSLLPINSDAKGLQGPEAINLCRNGKVAEVKPAKSKPAAPQQQTVWNGFAWVTVPVVQMPTPPPRWLIEPIRSNPILVIREGSRPYEFKLEMEDDQLTLNGRPYRITENTLCKSESRRPKNR